MFTRARRATLLAARGARSAGSFWRRPPSARGGYGSPAGASGWRRSGGLGLAVG